jgi:hypothetical protein
VSRRPLIGALAFLTLLTVVATWPQGAYLRSKVAAHNDPHFSMWRLAWIGHALRTDPRHVFDANIFYPAVRTLAYSDATLLEGAIAAPLLWAGMSPVLVYNVLLLGAIAASGLGMFVLSRYLTGSNGAAMVSGAIFMLAPYRLEHYMHLELQWTMWMPLAFWAVHRAVDQTSWKFGTLAGIFVWLQALSCVYYGLFLAMMVAVLTLLLLATDVRRARAALPGLLAGAIVAAAVTAPYARPYLQNASNLGPRDPAEIARYSAQPINYLASPPQNWLWGWTADRFGGNETRLFPGAIAVVLALTAVVYRPRRRVWMYAVMCAVAIELSFGLNGWLYTWLYTHAGAMHGFRAPARFAILVSSALAVMAGLGVAAVDRLRVARGLRIPAAAIALALLTLEHIPSQMFLREVPSGPPDVYRMLSSMGAGVVVELPMPTPERLPGYDAVYASWSTTHWHPLVNGYSGYYPAAYFETIERMRTFPDDSSIDRLTSLGVRYIVVHRSFYEPAEYASLLERMLARPQLKSSGRYRDPRGEAQLFELLTSARAPAGK